MGSSLAPIPPQGGFPATLEGVTSFRVKTAALSRPAAPAPPVHANMVLVTTADGGVVVYPASDRLVILAARRRRR